MVHQSCCESDSKLEKLKFAETVKIGARIVLSGARFSAWFWSILLREKLVPEWRNSGPDVS